MGRHPVRPDRRSSRCRMRSDSAAAPSESVSELAQHDVAVASGIGLKPAGNVDRSQPAALDRPIGERHRRPLIQRAEIVEDRPSSRGHGQAGARCDRRRCDWHAVESNPLCTSRSSVMINGHVYLGRWLRYHAPQVRRGCEGKHAIGRQHRAPEPGRAGPGRTPDQVDAAGSAVELASSRHAGHGVRADPRMGELTARDHAVLRLGDAPPGNASRFAHRPSLADWPPSRPNSSTPSGSGTDLAAQRTFPSPIGREADAGGAQVRSSSAIWTAFSAAPLRRLSLLTNRAKPRSPSTPGSGRIRPT